MASVLPEMGKCAPAKAHRLAIGTIMICASSLYYQPAFADPNAPAGSFTYSRDVPVRHAYLPGEPGDVHYVMTDPSEHVFGALQGLAPISDEQAAGVSAQTNPARDQALGTLPQALDIALMGENAASRTSMGETGGGLGGVISDSMTSAGSALSGALGVLGSTLGGE